MILIRMLIFLGLMGMPFLHAADTLSLADVLSLARTQSLPAFRARADFMQAKYRHQQFVAGLFPQISLAGTIPNYTKTFSQTTQPDGTIAFQRIAYNNAFLEMEISQTVAATGTRLFLQSNLQQYDDFSSDFRRFNGVPLRIGLQQTLSAWNPQRWQQRLDPVQVAESARQYQYDLEATAQAALLLFFDLLLAQIDGELADANLTGSLTLLDIARARYERGKISENDLLQLELEQINARKSVNDAHQAIFLATTRLSNFLRLQGRPEIYLLTPDATALPEVNLNDALRHASGNRPEYKTWERRRLEAAQETARARAQNGFQATVQASLGYAGSAATISPIYQSPQAEQGAWVTLSIPLVNWGRGKAARGLAETELEYINQWASQQELELETTVAQTLSAWKQARQTLGFALQAQEIARRQFEISQDRYRLGEISTTDLTLSLRAKDISRRNYAGSLRDYWITRQQMRLLTLYDFTNDTPIFHPLP